MRKVLLVVVLLCVSINAYAVTNDTFAGLSVGGDIGMAVDLTTVESDYTYSNLFAGAPDQFIHTTQKTDDDYDFNLVSDVNVDYNHPLNEKWYLGVGGSYFFEDTKSVQSDIYSINNPNNRGDRPIDYRVKTDIDSKTHFSVSIKPGYAFTDKIFGYMSVSYHYLRANITNRQLLDKTGLNGQTVYVNPSGTKNFDGLGIGGGIKYKIYQNWFLNLSGEWLLFDKQTTAGPSFSNAADESSFTQSIDVQPSWVDLKVGISYKF